MESVVRPLLSVCMIVKNEEPVLARALASAAGPDTELVVVDTGSTDRTVEIAREHGAKVFHFTWIDDFSAARNFAFAQATGAWMLVLDADEEIPPDVRARMNDVLRTTQDDAIRVSVACLDDRGIKTMGTPSTRFVRNGKGYGYEGRVHEVMDDAIRRASGTIGEADLPLLHHGYTLAESARKGRHERNLRLLEAAHEASPDDPRYWHYLGLELETKGDIEGASALFDRVLANTPDHGYTSWSASRLAAIHSTEREFGAAWAVAEIGCRRTVARDNCLIQLGNLALREGDADTALACALDLERSRGDGFVDRRTCHEIATELRLGAAVEKSANKATAKLQAQLLRAVKRYPRNYPLADLLVKVSQELRGASKGISEAVRLAKAAPATVAAALSALFRANAFEACVSLGKQRRMRNEPWSFALAKIGQRDEARKELALMGDGSTGHRIVFALAYDDSGLTEALALLQPIYADVAAKVLAGMKVGARATWIVTSWLATAIQMREERAVTALTAALPWPTSKREALRALLTHDEGEPLTALARALEHPLEPDALEVIGLVAYAHGDWSAAATMLAMRADAGDAPVRVYLRGADAMRRLGRPADAEALLAMGREARPGSVALSPSVRHEAIHAEAPPSLLKRAS